MLLHDLFHILGLYHRIENLIRINDHVRANLTHTEAAGLYNLDLILKACFFDFFHHLLIDGLAV